MKGKATLQLPVADIPVVILAGGKGIKLGKNGTNIPKTMVEVNNKPVLGYLLDCYRRAGFEKFIICAGTGMDMIKDYLALNYPDMRITVIDSGTASMTGSRLAQTKELIDKEFFCMTYGDTLADVDIKEIIASHLKWGARGTLLAVHNPTRFKILGLVDEEHLIKGFSEKPVLQKDYINGGFYVFNRSIFGLGTLTRDSNCVLEEEVLEELAANGELFAYKHDGFWQPLDNERDLEKLSKYLSGR